MGEQGAKRSPAGEGQAADLENVAGQAGGFATTALEAADASWKRAGGGSPNRSATTEPVPRRSAARSPIGPVVALMVRAPLAMRSPGSFTAAAKTQRASGCPSRLAAESCDSAIRFNGV
jgi:hypothetical protein